MRGRDQTTRTWPQAPSSAPTLLAAALLLAGSAPLAALPREAVAGPLAQQPVLDGAVLDDPGWGGVPVLSGFQQTTPDEGQPASQRTEVRVGYSADTLYVGVVCHDLQPGRIIVSESRRDAPLDETDSFQLMLDTYHDGQNGFVFGTNPAGIEYDGQVSRNGEGDGFNRDWDGSWQVRTLTGDFGWSAEFAIPFRTLRYAGGSAQTWGVNFQRNIRRRNESAFWAPVDRQFNLHRVSAAGILRGLQVQERSNLKLAPYALGRWQEEVGPPTTSGREGDLGLDIKYSLTPALTLDATVNTDFAQVEADEQQINLDRFSLFFPEKRPFFLENAGQFAVGTSEEVELFFSRRIGIGTDGTRVPILFGVRLSGKVRETTVGLLNMQTRAVEGSAPANNFAVLRVARELPNRSGLGAIFVNRQATGDTAESEDFNRAFGLDGRWGFGRFGSLAGYLARTVTPGQSGDDLAWHVSLSHNTPGWELFARFTEVGARFNPEVGFLRRRGYRKPQFLVFHRFRPENLLGLHELRPHVSYRGFWGLDGFQETGFLHVDNHFEWKSGYELHTGVNFTREGLRQPFEIFPGIVVPPGTYDHAEAMLVGFTNRGAPASLEVRLTAGGFFGGSRVSLRPTLKLRKGEAFNGELRWDRNDVTLTAGRFVTNLLRARLSYSFTPRIFLQALLQYNDRIDNWSSNLRFGWQQTANTGLFVVYNENRETTSGPAHLRDRSVIVKFSRLMDVLD